MGGFALNIRLLQGLHQQGQVLEQLAGVDILLYGADRPATDAFQAQGLPADSIKLPIFARIYRFDEATY